MYVKKDDLLGFNLSTSNNKETGLIWYIVDQVTSEGIHLKGITFKDARIFTFKSLQFYFDKNQIILAKTEQEKLFFDLKHK